MLTTSRDPSSRLIQFVKVSLTSEMLLVNLLYQELKQVFPNSSRVNRGNYHMKEMVESCRAHEFTDMVIVHEHRGEPGM